MQFGGCIYLRHCAHKRNLSRHLLENVKPRESFLDCIHDDAPHGPIEHPRQACRGRQENSRETRHPHLTLVRVELCCCGPEITLKLERLCEELGVHPQSVSEPSGVVVSPAAFPLGSTPKDLCQESPRERASNTDGCDCDLHC